jgi:hypothetical protein
MFINPFIISVQKRVFYPLCTTNCAVICFLLCLFILLISSCSVALSSVFPSFFALQNMSGRLLSHIYHFLGWIIQIQAAPLVAVCGV